MLLSGSSASFPHGVYASHAYGLLSSSTGYAASVAVGSEGVFASKCGKLIAGV
jgi:hypothetical protein